MHKFLLIYSWLIRILLFLLPDFPLAMRFRGWLYSFGMKSCGKNFQVTHSAILNSLESLEIGDNVYIANFCNLIGTGNIIIGNEVILGPGVIISAGNHHFSNNSFRFASSTPLDIIIGDGSWIAANCTIVGRSIFPAESVLAANSVFIPSSTNSSSGIYAGNPAKFIKKLTVNDK